jgi:hypothetical protein
MTMPQLTIKISEKATTALQRVAAARGRTVDQVVEESLEIAGILAQREAAALVDRARKSSDLSNAEALELAVTETRAVRRGRR